MTRLADRFQSAKLGILRGAVRQIPASVGSRKSRSEPKETAMAAPAYDPDNIFAKILRKEAPCYFICEDADTFVFLDIMPRSDGHALVIPKAPARNILDAAPGLLIPVIHTAQRVAIAAKNAFNADGVTVAQFSEAAGGQVVFHLHVHVMPR